MAKPIKLSDDTFDQAIKDHEILFVDFWAEWCGPCKMVAPILDELAEKYDGQITVGKLNTDDYPMTARKYGASSIPTFWAFKNGVAVGRIVGAYPKPAFIDVFEKLIKLTDEEIAAAQG